MSTDAALVPLRETYMERYKALTEIDKELDAGNDKLGKRAFINDLVTRYGAEIDHLAVSIDSYFTRTAENGGPSDDLFKVAIINGLLKKLEDKQETLDSVVEAALPKDKPAVEITPERLKELTENRSVLNKMLGAISSAYAAILGSAETGLPKVRARTGSRGPRGPRAISAYQFYLNSSQLPGPTNTLATVAKSVDGWKVKDLKAYMISKEVVKNFKELPEEWTVELPNGTVFSAKKIDAPPVDDDDDDDDDDDLGASDD